MTIRRVATATSVIVAVTAVLLVARNYSDDDQDVAKDAAQPEITLAHGSDHLPSTTASDWITYADHVVVVTAVDETALPPSPVELERGEGSIGREVALRVDDVVWSRDDAPRSAPRTWVWNGAGWQFSAHDPDNRVKFALSNRPRVEVGHTYIIAIVWECVTRPDDNGNEVLVPRWQGLGQGSTVPYDDAAIGHGEIEGRLQTAEDAAQAMSPDQPNFGLEDRLAGQDTTDLAAALNAATPDDQPEFDVQPGDSCT